MNIFKTLIFVTILGLSGCNIIVGDIKEDAHRLMVYKNIILDRIITLLDHKLITEEETALLERYEDLIINDCESLNKAAIVLLLEQEVPFYLGKDVIDSMEECRGTVRTIDKLTK